jgi:hypothetical protein
LVNVETRAAAEEVVGGPSRQGGDGGARRQRTGEAGQAARRKGIRGSGVEKWGGGDRVWLGFGAGPVLLYYPENKSRPLDDFGGW